MIQALSLSFLGSTRTNNSLTDDKQMKTSSINVIMAAIIVTVGIPLLCISLSLSLFPAPLIQSLW